MRKHPETRLKHIQDIGRCLIDEHIMSDKMRSDLDDVTNRWSKLSQQVCALKRLFRPSIQRHNIRSGTIHIVVSFAFVVQ